jgi:hypothetical protein
MTWLAFVLALEAAYLPMGSFHLYEPALQVVEPGIEFYVDLEARAVLWDLLYVGGSVRSNFHDVGDSRFFNPTAAAYTVEAGFERDGFKAGWRHYCTHPVIPYLSGTSMGRVWEGGYEEVFLRVEGRIGKK